MQAMRDVHIIQPRFSKFSHASSGLAMPFQHRPTYIMNGTESARGHGGVENIFAIHPRRILGVRGLMIGFGVDDDGDSDGGG